MKSPGCWKTPATTAGRRSVWLEAIFVVMFVVNVLILSFVKDETVYRQFILPFYALIMLLCGLVGGVFGLIAVIGVRERALLVWLAILMGLFVLLLVVNELLQGLMYFAGS